MMNILFQNIACMKFEGKLFQIKYNSLVEKKQRYYDLCEDDVSVVNASNRFYKLLLPFSV